MPAGELPDPFDCCNWTDWGTLQHEAALGCGVAWREWVAAFSPPWEAPFFAYDCGRAGEAVDGRVDFEGLLEGAEKAEAKVSGGWQESGECMNAHDWCAKTLESGSGSWSDARCVFDCGRDVGQGVYTLSGGEEEEEVWFEMVEDAGVDSGHSGCGLPAPESQSKSGSVHGNRFCSAVSYLALVVCYGIWISKSKHMDELGRRDRVS